MDILIDNYTSRFDLESHIFRDIEKGDKLIHKKLVLTLSYLDKNVE